MSSSEKASEMEEYWNGSGGTKWIENLSHIEKVLAPISDKILDAFSEQDNLSVLDVGCGGAQLAASLAVLIGDGSKVIASDISQPIIDVAKQNHGSVPNLEFLRCDVEHHPFESGIFDAVISRFGVMFFTDPVVAFGNIRKSMKTDGRLNLLVWKSFDENLWMKVPAVAAFEILEKPEPLAVGEPGPFSLAEEKLVEDILSKAGFRAISLKEIKVDLNLGELDEAAHLMTQLGPASRPFNEASKSHRETALGLIREALSKSDSTNGVALPAACWLIQATS